MYNSKELKQDEMQIWINKAISSGLISKQGIDKKVSAKNLDLIYPDSIQKKNNSIYAMIRLSSSRALLIIGKNEFKFSAKKYDAGFEIYACPLSAENAAVLRKAFPFLNPSSLSDKDVTFGLGDRLGIAGPGHLRLFKKYNAYPILAQQSVRELDLTGRNYQDVFNSAVWAVFQEGYDKPWGADGDHLKTIDWVKKALNIGFTMITADVSDYIRKEFAKMDDAQVISAYEKLPSKYRKTIEDKYLKISLELDTGYKVNFTKQSLAQIALIYKDAVDYAHELYQTGVKMKKKFDFELSVDETETPTLIEAHVFVAMEAQGKGIKISSLAPRFIGEFQKGIDYIGKKSEFEKAFKKHAAIARHFGYRISIHSGSDKFMVFPIIGKYTRGRFHIKTAGTNWLQALKVISQTEFSLFRKLYKFAIEAFPEAKKYYHITPDIDRLPYLEKLGNRNIVNVFKNNDARQVMHVTYGEMLKNKELNAEIFQTLDKNIEKYWESVALHIGKHVKLLKIKKA